MSKKKTWEKLNDTQIIKTLEIANQTIFVIAPRDYKKKVVPLFCPLCTYPMNTKEDITAYKKHKLCERCSYKWEYKDIRNIINREEYYEYLEILKELKKPKINFK